MLVTAMFTNHHPFQVFLGFFHPVHSPTKPERMEELPRIPSENQELSTYSKNQRAQRVVRRNSPSGDPQGMWVILIERGVIEILNSPDFSEHSYGMRGTVAGGLEIQYYSPDYAR